MTKGLDGVDTNRRGASRAGRGSKWRRNPLSLVSKYRKRFSVVGGVGHPILGMGRAKKEAVRFRVIAALVPLSIAGIVWLAPRLAAACSCEASTLLSPRAGATDVPLNAVIVFESPPAQAIVVHDLTHNAEVATTVEPFGDLAQTSLIRPVEPLSPNTTYEVRPPPLSGDPMSRFTTGTSTDDASPNDDGLTSFGAETVDIQSLPCRSSCLDGNTFHRLRLGYAAPPADTTLLLLELRAEGSDRPSGTVPLFRRYSEVWAQRIDEGVCNFAVPAFAPQQNLCARIVAFDMAGHRGASSPEICARAIACAPSVDMTCTPRDECLPIESDGGEAPDSGEAPDAGEASDGAVPQDATSGQNDGTAPPSAPMTEGVSCACSLSRAGGASGSGSAGFLGMLAATMLQRRRRRV